MNIQTAQYDVQTIFVRGSVGQMISGLIWLISAILATWNTRRIAILVLVLGGIFIFPLTQIALRLLGRPNSLPKGHPMNQLAMQTAFIVPLSLPLIGAASLYHLNWFYPAFMLVVGVHYMPFMFLYGMWEFAVLAAVLICAAVGFAMWLPQSFSAGGWFTAAVLVLFAVLVQFSALKRRASFPIG